LINRTQKGRGARCGRFGKKNKEKSKGEDSRITPSSLFETSKESAISREAEELVIRPNGVRVGLVGWSEKSAGRKGKESQTTRSERGRRGVRESMNEEMPTLKRE